MTSDRKEKTHSRQRALQRHGINLGPETRRDFISQIQKNKAVFLERKSNRLSAFAVTYYGEWIPVLYDKKRGEIATFYPSDYLNKYQGLLEQHVF